MLTEKKIKEVLEALSNAGLIVAESKILGPLHPAGLPDHEYVIGRIEESGGLDP